MNFSYNSYLAKRTAESVLFESFLILEVIQSQ